MANCVCMTCNSTYCNYATKLVIVSKPLTWESSPLLSIFRYTKCAPSNISFHLAESFWIFRRCWSSAFLNLISLAFNFLIAINSHLTWNPTEIISIQRQTFEKLFRAISEFEVIIRAIYYPKDNNYALLACHSPLKWTQHTSLPLPYSIFIVLSLLRFRNDVLMSHQFSL